MKVEKNRIDRKKMIKWDVKVEKSEYELDEIVRVFGYFSSEATEKSSLIVHTLLKHTEMEDFPAGIIPFPLQLESGEEKEVLIREFKVTNDYPPGTYNLKVGLDIERRLIEFKEINFRIKGTLKPLDFQIIISRDREGVKKAKVFTSKDKEIFISLKSTPENFVASGVCVNPERKEISLEFEELATRYELSGNGVYILEVRGQAKGYRSLTKHLLFSVIEQRPRFNINESHDVLSRRG